MYDLLEDDLANPESSHDFGKDVIPRVVREGRAVRVESYQLSCVSHRRIDGYEQLARALHPEAFTVAKPVTTTLTLP